jgi:hypothetical protein
MLILLARSNDKFSCLIALEFVYSVDIAIRVIVGQLHFFNDATTFAKSCRKIVIQDYQIFFNHGHNGILEPGLGGNGVIVNPNHVLVVR